MASGLDTQQNIIAYIEYCSANRENLAASKLANHLIAELDNWKNPTNIYIDLSKAFDKLNFDILLNKLDHYGANESTKRLIHSYLTDRFHKRLWTLIDINRLTYQFLLGFHKDQC